MSPRVALMTQADAPLLARPYFADGEPDPITATLAQVPELMDVTLPFLGAILGPSFVSLRAKEIVILRTSALLECDYCVGAHTVAAGDAGLTGEELRALRGDGEWSGVFADPAELALLGWIDAVGLGRGAVGDDVAADLRAHFSDPEVVELTVLIGATMMLNRLCTALELPLGAPTELRLSEQGFGS
jgi:AhpD family alkylhydroperoxidase